MKIGLEGKLGTRVATGYIPENTVIAPANSGFATGKNGSGVIHSTVSSTINRSEGK